MKKENLVLKEQKHFKNLTAMAKRAGCSKTHLSYVMHGERKPGPALVKRLKKLGVVVPTIAEEVASC